MVWDDLHNYPHPSQLSDLDVIYFDSLSATKPHDKALEKKLYEKIPNMTWSVKNQARMHTWNEEAQYESLDDAISKWPETCTAIAVRLNADNELEYIAPFGFSDLYRLMVVPTPHFEQKIEKYKIRIIDKNWKKTWNKLRIING